MAVVVWMGGSYWAADMPGAMANDWDNEPSEKKTKQNLDLHVDIYCQAPGMTQVAECIVVKYTEKLFIFSP